MKFSLSIPALLALAASPMHAMILPTDVNSIAASDSTSKIESALCNTVTFLYNPEYLVQKNNAVGKTQRVPITGAADATLSGEMTLAVTDIWDHHSHNKTNHCLLYGSIKFDLRDDGSNIYDNQILIQGSCDAGPNPS